MSSIQHADPGAIAVGDEFVALCLPLVGVVAGVERDGDVHRFTLKDQPGLLTATTTAAGPTWRWQGPEGEPVHLTPDDILHHPLPGQAPAPATEATRPQAAPDPAPQPAPAPPPTPRPVRPTVRPGCVLGCLVLALLVCMSPFMGLGMLLWAAPWKRAEVLETRTVTLGEPLALEVQVPAARTAGLDLRLQTLPVLDEGWALVGTLEVDGVDFPVRITDSAPPVHGLTSKENRLLKGTLEPGGQRRRGQVLLGVIPARDTAHTARVTLQLAPEGAVAVERLELQVRVRPDRSAE